MLILKLRTRREPQICVKQARYDLRVVAYFYNEKLNHFFIQKRNVVRHITVILFIKRRNFLLIFSKALIVFKQRTLK